jgi:aspartyl/asparaginyl-tRNA synthetase
MKALILNEILKESWKIKLNFEMIIKKLKHYKKRKFEKIFKIRNKIISKNFHFFFKNQKFSLF